MVVESAEEEHTLKSKGWINLLGNIPRVYSPNFHVLPVLYLHISFTNIFSSHYIIDPVSFRSLLHDLFAHVWLSLHFLCSYYVITSPDLYCNFIFPHHTPPSSSFTLAHLRSHLFPHDILIFLPCSRNLKVFRLILASCARFGLPPAVLRQSSPQVYTPPTYSARCV